MTIATTANEISFVGSGTTAPLVFPYRVDEAAELGVFLVEDGLETEKTVNADYTILVDASFAFATVTPLSGFAVAAAGKTILLRRTLPFTQTLGLVVNSRLDAKNVEKALDRAVMRDQQLSTRVAGLEAYTLTIQESVVSADASAQAAALSADEAASSEANAAASATAAAASATAANTSKDAAATSETNAAASATAAVASATAANTSKNNAATSETNAAAFAASAAASFSNFDARYLGAKASNPSVDNSGGALIDGALYWNTGTKTFRAYKVSDTSWNELAGVGTAGVYINVHDYGAVGNGVTNDTAAIQAAIDDAPSGATIVFPTATYYFTNLASNKALTLDFCGSDLNVAPGIASLSSAKPAIEFAGTLVTPRNLINTVAENADRVDLVSGLASSLFAVGDYVEFFDLTPVKGWDEETILTTTVSAGGSGFTNGEFVELVATSGVGTNACGTVAVTAGAVTGITIVSGGTGFQVGNTFNIVPTNTGGTGATGTVATIGGGASRTNTGRKEINRVKALSGSTIYLDKSVEWAYDSAYTASITKVIPVIQPRIINVGTVREVDPGGVYTGSSIGGPHIFRFALCVDPILSRARVEGWQMDVCQLTSCVNPLVEHITATKPFRPLEGGHGYVIQFDRSSRGLARKIVGHATRHTVDFTQAYDCVSQNNTGFAPGGAQFVCHGQGAKRCRSVDDTVYLGGGDLPFGWSCGNPTFSKDYDYTVVRPTAIGACASLTSSAVIFQTLAGAERFTVIDPIVRVSSPSGSGYVKVFLQSGGAMDAMLIGGSIDVSGVLGTSGADGVYKAEATVSGSAGSVRPINATIKGCRIKGPGAASSHAVYTPQLAGYFRAYDLEFTSAGASQRNIRVGTTPLDEIDIRNTRHFGGGGRGILTEAAPLKRYRCYDNYYVGTFSTAAEALAVSALLVTGKLPAYLSGSTTYDPASLADGAGVTTTVTVTGAVVGDLVVVSHTQNLQGITVTGYVSGANTVAVRFQNESGGALDIASGTLKCIVLKCD